MKNYTDIIYEIFIFTRKAQSFSMNDYLSIKEVKQLPVNSEFKVAGIISRLNRRRDRNNNPFWDLTLSDKTGDLDGKVWYLAVWWNSSQENEKFPIDPDNCDLNFEGASVCIVGRIAEFKDQLQYNFESVYYLNQNDFPPENFTKHSPLSLDSLAYSFRNLIESIQYPPLREFVNNIFFKHNLWDKFQSWPAAASIHHAYTHGLLEHSVSVALGALDLAKHYSEFGIPLNTDLITAGALLHDIGKTEVYSPMPSPSMNLAGNVIDHIAIGHHIFMKFAELEKLDDDITMAIAHIILSHHGRREFGSPVLPATPEAMIVSAADDIDFKLSFWKTQIDSLVPNSELTDFLPMIERKLWKGIRQR